MYKQQRNYENLNKQCFEENDGIYGVPRIKPTRFASCSEWIGFNYVSKSVEREEKGVHFFLDDYQFVRTWNQPDRYLELLKRFKYVLAPDFSLYVDYPVALQIYNHYRKHWLAAYWQQNGINVIPTIGWSDVNSFQWCFDGEPRHATVAVSSVGCMRSRECKRLFIEGYKEMIRRLEPETILFYGNPPEECEGNVIHIAAYQEKYREL